MKDMKDSKPLGKYSETSPDKELIGSHAPWLPSTSTPHVAVLCQVHIGDDVNNWLIRLSWGGGNFGGSLKFPWLQLISWIQTPLSKHLSFFRQNSYLYLVVFATQLQHMRNRQFLEDLPNRSVAETIDMAISHKVKIRVF